MKLIYYLLFLILFSICLNANTITHIKIDSTISPATATYLKDAFKHTKTHNSSLLLIELNTPGGLATSMREMIQDILNSEIPVVVYVSPKGSRAASAGTYLMYASHIAVMSPGTNIGAATPVNLISIPKESQKDEKGKKTNKKENTDRSAMEKKVINDSIAYIKSIAELRNRNIPWAIEAVKEGKSISSKEALEKNVIDYVANDIKELLSLIHNKKILINKKEIVLDTSNANILMFAASWKTSFLMKIANPNIAYIFLIIGMYGILFEMMNPGSLFPGVIGITSGLIAMYSLNILPFNYVGLLLIFLGVAFMIAEVFISGFGILGIAGVVSFAFGSIFLFDEKTLGEGVSIPLIMAFSFVSLAFFVFLFGFLIKSRKNKTVSGLETLIGKHAKVVEVKNGSYKIRLDAELWNAVGDKEFLLNEDVIVENIDGLIVKIRSLK